MPRPSKQVRNGGLLLARPNEWIFAMLFWPVRQTLNVGASRELRGALPSSAIVARKEEALILLLAECRGF